MIAFQSALPHGERRTWFNARDWNDKFQSALPHGERPPGSMLATGTISFNPRSRMGSDCWTGSIRASLIRFQSALPHGERLTRLPVPIHGACFNPRSRMGSDRLELHIGAASLGFNPRSRMGSDCVSAGFVSSLLVSIRAPAWGATGLTPPIRPPIARFNPRSRMGSDGNFAVTPSVFACFNPRSRMGSDIFQQTR